MPIIAGFDIGMLNLSFCVIDTCKWKRYVVGESTDPGILAWELINLIGESEKCMHLITTGTRAGSACGCAAKWIEGDGHYCGKHAKEKLKEYKPRNTKNVNINTVREAAIRKLDTYASLFNGIHKIVIEGQPRVNQKMKMFAASIETYFIVRYFVDSSDSVLRSIGRSPAKNKLRVYNGPAIETSHIKDPYARRKYLAVEHTRQMLSRADSTIMQTFNASCKKDDLADAFLHAVLHIS